MKLAAKIITVVIGLYVSLNGIVFMFKPDLVLGSAQLSADSIFGLSTVRGLIGGSMLATGILTLLAIFKEKLELLHPVAIIMLGWTLGRIVSLGIDGFNVQILSGSLISLLMATLITASFRVLSKEEEKVLA